MSFEITVKQLRLVNSARPSGTVAQPQPIEFDIQGFLKQADAVVPISAMMQAHSSAGNSLLANALFPLIMVLMY